MGELHNCKLASEYQVHHGWCFFKMQIPIYSAGWHGLAKLIFPGDSVCKGFINSFLGLGASHLECVQNHISSV